MLFVTRHLVEYGGWYIAIIVMFDPGIFVDHTATEMIAVGLHPVS